MAPNMWLFFVMAGWLMAALSGPSSPAPSSQLNTSRAEIKPLEPGERLGVRLVNGSSRCGGTVEVRLGEAWEPACGALWGGRAAEAVCRALGCGGAQAGVQAVQPTWKPPPGSPAGNASGPPNATQASAPAIVCLSAEWQFCEVVEHACSRDGTAAQVTCAENRALRLEDGGRCAGRVEMLEYGEWGSVCDDTWDLEDAHVVCRQLGCGWAIQALPGLHFAPGQGPIHRDQVNCSGAEAYLWDCPGLPGDRYCGHKEDAGVVCSGSHNRSSPEAPTSLRPVTVESSVTVITEDKGSQELKLLIPCIILGALLLGSFIFIVFLLLKVKGKYAFPVTVNHQHLPTTTPAGINSYQEVSIAIPKEEVPKLPIQVRAPPPEDSDSSSDSDYEHYDFSAQPPVALTTFYNSQRHRVTDEEVQRSRFQMPPLEEDPPSLGPQHHPGHGSSSSTSSGEDYCNSPSSKLPPPWNPQVFSSERNLLWQQPPNLELAGSQPILSEGDAPGLPAGPSADDSSSTSSGEWYQNFQPPPQPPSMEQSEYPAIPSPEPDSTDDDDYDDIGAA
ncbi:T-cell differentiation antigen CD6 isoform X5 [Elephas maximus indicus]|uniref:T-cell differentiation antigen CD6 isoform X5 n=1 Tax=Elephas maximus indicus TaxID=99487 RepID=UPI00211615EA|nr:T-cell differentiation antigen CD6 isoform X5 [Elephas maximus indicus]